MDRPQDTTQRFSTRVDNYVRYRPGYPDAILQILADRCNRRPEQVFADIGSGTGNLSEVWLKAGHQVYGVEPNAPMRTAAEERFHSAPGFHSIDGRAEQTTLPEGSVDFITAGQAAHWFDLHPTHEEFARILRPQGWVVFIWNDPLSQQVPCLQKSLGLLRRYGSNGLSDLEARLKLSRYKTFFTLPIMVEQIPVLEAFDWNRFLGRLESSSTMLEPDAPQYNRLVEGLRQIFEAHQEDGQITVPYRTVVLMGRLADS